MVDEHSEFVFLGIVQDAVDGVVSGDVLYLAAAEVVLRCKCLGIHLAQVCLNTGMSQIEANNKMHDLTLIASRPNIS